MRWRTNREKGNDKAWPQDSTYDFVQQLPSIMIRAGFWGEWYKAKHQGAFSEDSEL